MFGIIIRFIIFGLSGFFGTASFLGSILGDILIAIVGGIFGFIIAIVLVNIIVNRLTQTSNKITKSSTVKK